MAKKIKRNLAYLILTVLISLITLLFMGHAISEETRAKHSKEFYLIEQLLILNRLEEGKMKVDECLSVLLERRVEEFGIALTAKEYLSTLVLLKRLAKGEITKNECFSGLQRIEAEETNEKYKQIPIPPKSPETDWKSFIPLILIASAIALILGFYLFVRRERKLYGPTGGNIMSTTWIFGLGAGSLILLVGLEKLDYYGLEDALSYLISSCFFFCGTWALTSFLKRKFIKKEKQG
jgi:hypothetical protein